MKNEDVNDLLNKIDLPGIENIKHQQEMKIPLLSYKKSSRAGMWLLALPVIFAVTAVLKYEFIIASSFLNMIEGFFKAINNNEILTYLIPVIFVGFPLFTMIINMLAFCHFASIQGKKELLITIKYRPFNILLFFFSFALIVYFFLPDNMP